MPDLARTGGVRARATEVDLQGRLAVPHGAAEAEAVNAARDWFLEHLAPAG